MGCFEVLARWMPPLTSGAPWSNSLRYCALLPCLRGFTNRLRRWQSGCCWYKAFADLKHEIPTIIAQRIKLPVSRGPPVVREVHHLLMQEQAKLGPCDIPIVIDHGVRLFPCENIQEQLAKRPVV
jgi:hypothetical protein